MSQENLVCPLCMECLDIDDHTFIPCTCGYQICRFCWHRIKTAESGTCPACRKPYTEGPAQFQPLSTTELQEIKKKQKLKESEEKKKSLEKCNKFFANARVIQKNLMFVVGLPANIADSEVLRRQEYFGKLGKITKITLTKMTPPMVSMTTAHQNGTNSNNTSTYQFQSAYVMFARIEDALRAIKTINSSQNQFGKSVKASLGTTKYCSRFIKGLPCLKPECMYLHETVDEEACFTKEEIQQGKHTTYEQKLYSQYCKDEPTPRTPSPNAQVLTVNGAQKQTTCSQSKTTQSTPVSVKKPIDLGVTNCWKVGGAAIVKASLATSSSPVTNQKKPLMTAPQNGTVAAMLKQSAVNKTSEVEKNKIEDQNSNGRLSPVVTNNRNPSTSSSNDEIEENFERLSYASSRTSNEGDLDSNSSEAITPELPHTPQETSSPSSEEGITADVLQLEDLKEEEEPRQATPEPDFFDGVKDENPMTPSRNFYDDISSTPAAKRVVLPSVLDVSDIEADLTDLKVDDQNSLSLDCSRDDDRHDDDIDPWKIVSIGLDLLENERILEERPQYCQTTTHEEGHGSSLLVSCGLQSLRENNRLSQYDPFSNNKNNNNGHSMMNNTDFLDSAVRNNFQQQQQLEEMLLQRRQQQQRLLMLQQQAMRSPSYPSLSDSFFGQDSNFMANQSLFMSQDQQSPMLGQYSSGPLHQQHLQQQQYLFLQQQRQQQMQRQQFELANQRLHMSGMFNGHPHSNAAPFMNGHSQQEQLSQSLPIEHKRWQDGLKALFPNVNISFGPSPPFVKEAPPTTQHDNISINSSFRTRVENGSMHDMATLDPAIVNTGAVANHPSNNDNYLVQQQQQQYSQLGLNFPMDNYARAHSMQQLPTMNARPYDWPVLTNGMSEVSHNVPQLVRRANAVPPPPGFEKMHPQKTDL